MRLGTGVHSLSARSFKVRHVEFVWRVEELRLGCTWMQLSLLVKFPVLGSSDYAKDREVRQG